MVVATVAQYHVGAALGVTRLVPHLRHGLQERDRLGDVVAVAACEGGREWDAGGVDDQMMLAARPAPVDKTSSGLGSSFIARMWVP